MSRLAKKSFPDLPISYLQKIIEDAARHEWEEGDAMNRTSVVEVLSTQYRMHPYIAKYHSREFYHGRLLIGISREQRPPPPGFDWPKLHCPNVFMPVDGEADRKDGETLENGVQARMCVKVVKGFLDDKEREHWQDVTSQFSLLTTCKKESSRSC